MEEKEDNSVKRLIKDYMDKEIEVVSKIGRDKYAQNVKELEALAKKEEEKKETSKVDDKEDN